jgi:hypothetical protein
LLWTDSLFISQSDLSRIDSEIPNVATAENIVLAGDNGLIKGAIEECSNELLKLIVAFGGYLNSGDLSANHLAAVLNVGIGNSVRTKATLDQVCVSGNSATSWNHVKNWTVAWTLRLFYRDAYSRTSNDRYKAKMDQYKDDLARRLTPAIYALGVPIVLQPLSAPAAYFTRNPGTWDSTDVDTVAGPGTLDNQSVDVTVTYVDQSQPNRYQSYAQSNNAESDAPPVVTQSLVTGQVLQVDVSNLNPPTGAQDPAQILTCVVAPLMATGWNVYVGLTGGTLWLQNSTPIPIATTSYTFSGDPVFKNGKPQLIGQYQNRRLSITPTRQRA